MRTSMSRPKSSRQSTWVLRSSLRIPRRRRGGTYPPPSGGLGFVLGWIPTLLADHSERAKILLLEALDFPEMKVDGVSERVRPTCRRWHVERRGQTSQGLAVNAMVVRGLNVKLKPALSSSPARLQWTEISSSEMTSTSALRNPGSTQAGAVTI